MKTPLCRTLLVTILTIVVVQPSHPGAYELRTHGEITRRAYETSEGIRAYLQAVGLSDVDTFDLPARTPPERLALFENTGTALDWLIEGAIREDDYKDDTLAALLGCPRPANAPSASSRVLNHFFDVQRGGQGLTVAGGQRGFPAPDWALGRQGRGSAPTENQFSLPDAREYQYLSLVSSSLVTRGTYTALLFRTLGHVLHLIEDLAQPQHTRNDPHAGCMELLNPIFGAHSWFEQYVEGRALGREYRSRGEIPREIVLAGYDPVPSRPYQDLFADSGGGGIANFSSKNFLSAGTNLAVTLGNCGGLPQPPCEISAYGKEVQTFTIPTRAGPTISGKVTLYTRDVVDALTGSVISNVPVSSRSVWDQHLEARQLLPLFSLNSINYDAMADILLPRAVGYAAGFLDTFFRGSLSAGFENDKLRISGAIETMVGDFTLLYEKADGTRQELAAWAGLQIEPHEVSAPLSAPQLPEDAASGAPCWLVFRGQLGTETGVVMGSRVGCPSLPPHTDSWFVYFCTYLQYGIPTPIRYYYATVSPPLEDSGLHVVDFAFDTPTGHIRCGIAGGGMAEQPPNTRTDHPA